MMVSSRPNVWLVTYVLGEERVPTVLPVSHVDGVLGSCKGALHWFPKGAAGARDVWI